jgi:hypothetical protein
VVLGVDGISNFDNLMSGEFNDDVQFYAFDIQAGDGDDMQVATVDAQGEPSSSSRPQAKF